MKLVFATNNQHKLQEVRQILPAEIKIISLQEIGFIQDIEETGLTLEENSTLKARTIWEWINQKALLDQIDGVFADDTGLEIAALNGAPGVRTARWAGEDANDSNNRAKTLQVLATESDRRAQFRTVITLITQNQTLQVEGIIHGNTALSEEGEGGFGYDPIFIPDGYKKTFASLPSEVKNTISHRARAIEALRDIIIER
jgi:XTP/dITP diphosphohydrolase